MRPCSLVGCSERFGGACFLSLQVVNEPSWKKRQFYMEEVLGKVGRGEEMDHLPRASEVKRR